MTNINLNINIQKVEYATLVLGCLVLTINDKDLKC